MISVRTLAVAAIIGTIFMQAARAGGSGEEIGFETGEVVIETRAGSHVIAVEIARSSEERAQGLMGREDLEPGNGMLFIYPGEGPVSMWMRNTYISLDMIFIRGDGTVAAIETDTLPLSTGMISPGIPVHAVLELRAGSAQQMGLQVGDVVRHETFAPRQAPATVRSPPVEAVE